MLHIDVPVQVRRAPELSSNRLDLELGHIAHQLDLSRTDCAPGEADTCRGAHQRAVRPAVSCTPGNEGLRVTADACLIERGDIVGTIRIQIGDDEVFTRSASRAGILECQLGQVQRIAAVFADDGMPMNGSITLKGIDVYPVHFVILNIGRNALGVRGVKGHYAEGNINYLLTAALHSESRIQRLRLASGQCQQHRRNQISDCLPHSPSRFRFRHSLYNPCRCCQSRSRSSLLR